MPIPTIPRNFRPFFQIGPIGSGTDSTMNAPARSSVGVHDIEASFSWLPFPRPGVVHAECNVSSGSIPARVVPHTRLSTQMLLWLASLSKGEKFLNSIFVGKDQ